MESKLIRNIACTVLASASILFMSTLPAVAWTGPTAAPPSNNTSAPVNVSSNAQVKAGNLGLNGGYGGGAGSPISVGGLASGWTGIFNWPYNTTPSNSLGILVGGLYSQFENPSGIWTELPVGSYGLETNGMIYNGATFYTNGDIYMPWAGTYLSTYLSSRSSWSMFAQFPGSGGCFAPNPSTGGCSCPSGTSLYGFGASSWSTASGGVNFYACH